MVIEEFKAQVLADYKLAFLASQVCTLAAERWSDVPVTSGVDVAQVALAKYVHGTDRYVSSSVDFTYALASGETDACRFYNRLRRMKQENKSYVPHWQDVLSFARAFQRGSAKGSSSVVFVTLPSEALGQGAFLESLFSAVVEQLPVAFVVWNDASIYPNATVSKLFSGFSHLRRDRQGVSVQTVKGNDYVALCRTFEHQVGVSRSESAPTLTIVERSVDDTDMLSSWIIDKQISQKEQISVIEKACVEASRYGLES
ncbi:MAG: hypothetical protein MJZ18_00385 [Bacteroidales bacterium]|nr:hypothetical protein [Bacteroidales bacterium]